MNKAILTGRLVRNPELKESGDSKVTRFTLAVTRQFKRDEADFITCVAFGKNAENIAKYCTKGSPLAIVGNIRTGSYDKDGTKVYTTVVVLESFEFVGGKNDGNNAGNGNKGDNADNDFDAEPVNDDDVPF